MLQPRNDSSVRPQTGFLRERERERGRGREIERERERERERKIGVRSQESAVSSQERLQGG